MSQPHPNGLKDENNNNIDVVTTSSQSTNQSDPINPPISVSSEPTSQSSEPTSHSSILSQLQSSFELGNFSGQIAMQEGGNDPKEQNNGDNNSNVIHSSKRPSVDDDMEILLTSLAAAQSSYQKLNDINDERYNQKLNSDSIVTKNIVTKGENNIDENIEIENIIATTSAKFESIRPSSITEPSSRTKPIDSKIKVQSQIQLIPRFGGMAEMFLQHKLAHPPSEFTQKTTFKSKKCDVSHNINTNGLHEVDITMRYNENFTLQHRLTQDLGIEESNDVNGTNEGGLNHSGSNNDLKKSKRKLTPISTQQIHPNSYTELKYKNSKHGSLSLILTNMERKSSVTGNLSLNVTPEITYDFNIEFPFTKSKNNNNNNNNGQNNRNNNDKALTSSGQIAMNNINNNPTTNNNNSNTINPTTTNNNKQSSPFNFTLGPTNNPVIKTGIQYKPHKIPIATKFQYSTGNNKLTTSLSYQIPFDSLFKLFTKTKNTHKNNSNNINVTPYIPSSNYIDPFIDPNNPQQAKLTAGINTTTLLPSILKQGIINSTKVDLGVQYEIPQHYGIAINLTPNLGTLGNLNPLDSFVSKQSPPSSSPCADSTTSINNNSGSDNNNLATNSNKGILKTLGTIFSLRLNNSIYNEQIEQLYGMMVAEHRKAQQLYPYYVDDNNNTNNGGNDNTTANTNTTHTLKTGQNPPVLTPPPPITQFTAPPISSSLPNTNNNSNTALLSSSSSSLYSDLTTRLWYMPNPSVQIATKIVKNPIFTNINFATKFRLGANVTFSSRSSFSSISPYTMPTGIHCEYTLPTRSTNGGGSGASSMNSSSQSGSAGVCSLGVGLYTDMLRPFNHKLTKVGFNANISADKIGSIGNLVDTIFTPTTTTTGISKNNNYKTNYYSGPDLDYNYINSDFGYLDYNYSGLHNDDDNNKNNSAKKAPKPPSGRDVSIYSKTHGINVNNDNNTKGGAKNDTDGSNTNNFIYDDGFVIGEEKCKLYNVHIDNLTLSNDTSSNTTTNNTTTVTDAHVDPQTGYFKKNFSFYDYSTGTKMRVR